MTIAPPRSRTPGRGLLLACNRFVAIVTAPGHHANNPPTRLTDLTAATPRGCQRGSNDMWEGRKVTDRAVNVGCVVAYGLWVAAIGFIVAGWVVDSLHMENLALVLSAAAATAMVRCYFVSTNKLMRTLHQGTRESTGVPMRTMR